MSSTPLSLAQLETQIATYFADNSQGLITPLIMRTFMNSLVASMSLGALVRQVTSVNVPAINVNDFVIALNKVAGSDTGVTLPAVATRAQASGAGVNVGAGLWIIDWSGLGQTITMTPAAGETIMGRATWQMVSGGAGLGAKIFLMPSTILSGWLVLSG